MRIMNREIEHTVDWWCECLNFYAWASRADGWNRHFDYIGFSRVDERMGEVCKWSAYKQLCGRKNAPAIWVTNRRPIDDVCFIRALGNESESFQEKFRDFFQWTRDNNISTKSCKLIVVVDAVRSTLWGMRGGNVMKSAKSFFGFAGCGTSSVELWSWHAELWEFQFTFIDIVELENSKEKNTLFVYNKNQDQKILLMTFYMCTHKTTAKPDRESIEGPPTARTERDRPECGSVFSITILHLKRRKSIIFKFIGLSTLALWRASWNKKFKFSY